MVTAELAPVVHEYLEACGVSQADRTARVRAWLVATQFALGLVCPKCCADGVHPRAFGPEIDARLTTGENTPWYSCRECGHQWPALQG